jgi:DNA-binding winged helix-turn-helix (wHTH) protein
MADAKERDDDRPQRRRWSFADCVFDEANWTLSVDGRRVAVETKPLELLRELLERAGDLVSKDELLDAIWPNVMVVEASLPTAIRKLRLALNDDQRQVHIIETVPRFGYRLAVPVEVAGNQGGEREEIAAEVADTGRRRMIRAGGWLGIAGALTAAIAVVAVPLASSGEVPTTQSAVPVSQHDAKNAIRRLDVEAIERMLAAGWDPNLEIEAEGNAALHRAVEICEWDPQHDQARLLLMVRTLYEGGGRYEQRNVWGDTPYSIAKAERYCGPDHPVTKSIRTSCFQGGGTLLGDRCLASYEIERRKGG